MFGTYTLTATFAACALLMAAASAVTPYVSRKSESFGVRIPEREFRSGEVRGLRRLHTCWSLGAGAACALLISLLTALLGEREMLIAAAVLAQAFFHVYCYVIFHRKMVLLKQSAAWRDNTTGQVHVLLTPGPSAKAVSPLWLAAALAILAATIAATVLLYPAAPASIATSFDLAGNPVNIRDKTPLTASLVPVVQAFVIAMFQFVGYVCRTSKRTLDVGDPEKSARQVEAFRAAWSRFAGWGCIWLTAAFALLQLSLMGPLPYPVAAAALGTAAVLAMVYAAYLMVRYGQGGSRLKIPDKQEGTTVYDDDKYWKLGVLYCNPDDPSLFVEKRYGVGFTSNFGRPLTWVMAGTLLVAMAVILLFALRAG